jgi:tripartite-type tricarboxylate transporter receptor subunit TctC
MRSFIRNLLGATGLVCIVAPLSVHPQAYPSKPVRIIVPHSAGGPGDVLARGVAQSLGQTLGQPFVVENRVGTDSIIAVEACVRAAPDGSTVCSVDSFAITLNPVVRSKLSYDPDRDLAPVSQFGTMGSAFSVGATVPANSLKELFELAKARPESLAFGTYGLASANHLYVEWLRNAKGIRFLNVPYKAATQAMQALLSGEIQVVAYSLGASLPHAKAGKIKILAVAGDERSAVLPNVPSFKEAGLDISIRTWFGLFAPIATPREIVLRLNAEVAKLLRVPQFKDKFLAAQGIEMNGPAGGSVEDFTQYIRQEREMYANMVKVIGLKLD